MARDFSKNTSNYCLLGANAINPLLSGAPGVTVSAWINGDAFDATDFNNRIFVALMTGTSTSGIVLCVAGGPPARARFAIRSENGGTLYTCDGATTLSTGTWYNIVGVADIAGDSMATYLQGASDATASTAFTSTSFTPSTPTGNDTIGCVVGAGGTTPGATGVQFDGRIAELAIWKAALSAGEIAGLGRGASALRYRPNSLVAYYPLIGLGSAERSLVTGGPSAAITGSIPWATHPPVAPPFGGSHRSPYVISAPAATFRPPARLIRPHFHPAVFQE